MGANEVVHPQEEPGPPGVLPSDDRSLLVAVGARQQDAGGRTLWSNDDPPLWPAIVGRRSSVLDELEADAVDEKGDRLVVVIDDERDEFEIHRPTVTG
jgi:hypothetical protein